MLNKNIPVILRQRLKSAFLGGMLGLLIPSLAFGQATLLPNGVQQYFNSNGQPVANGQVYYYVPSTTTPKTVWQDAGETTPQANPVQLNAAGEPQPAGQTYGSGCYQQVVQDSNFNQIWSVPTCSTGSSSGGGAAFSEGVMVGTIIQWASPTLPNLYLYAAGQAISRTTYAQLLTALTSSLITVCQTGIAIISVPIAISDTTPLGAAIEATCFAPGTTVISKSSGILTMSSNATATTSTNITVFPWGNGDGAATFNVPDYRGRTPFGRDNMGGAIAGRVTSPFFGSNPDAINATGGAQSETLLAANLPPHTHTSPTLTDPGHTHTYNNVNHTSELSGGGVFSTGTNSISNTGTSTTGITLSASTGTNSSGTSTAFALIPPALTSDYIIKALPDVLPSGSGVTSLGNMTGNIACGTGLTCTGNTVNVNVLTGVTAVNAQTGNITIAGGNGIAVSTVGTTITVNGSNGAAITPSKVNNICYIDGTTITSLANAVATCTSNATIIVPSAQSISSNIAVSGNGVIIRCENNATLTYSANITITFSGNADAIQGCNLAGPGTGTSTSPPIKFTNTNFTIRNNNISGFGSTSLTGIIAGASTGGSLTGLVMDGNNLTGNADLAFFIGGSGTFQGGEITGNYLNNGFYILPLTGGVFQHILIDHNRIDAGSAAFTSPISCMQILGGNANMLNITINNNQCHALGNLTAAGAECMGVGGINFLSMSNNQCISSSFTWPIGIELNQVSYFSVNANTIQSGGAASYGIYAENPNNGTISNNSIQGFGTASANAGIDLLVNTTNLNMLNVAVTGNSIAFPVSGAGRGIAIECSQATTCSWFTVTGNVIQSDGTAGSTGIAFTRAAGSTANYASVTGNTIFAPTTDISGATSFGDICTGSNTSAATGTSMMIAQTTVVSLATAATHCH